MTLRDLKRHAVAASLFPATTLGRAVEKLGFVQADPIRSPARAQDLILRHRVKDYRAGDLEQRYAALGLEEDFLYAYGFMPRSTWQLLHPRGSDKLTRIETRIIEIVTTHRQIHPRDLEAYLGAKRARNDWGGFSKATTRALQELHYRGLLRISGRDKGIRLYEAATRHEQTMDPSGRLRALVRLMAQILAPLPDRSLRETVRYLRHSAPALAGRGSIVSEMIDSGELANAVVDGIRYVWPAGRVIRKEPDDAVRFLAPFDPMVWDRRRFEHFWGWQYRFEAYTPVAKRKLGYYAMPLLWRDEVVGWVNIAQREGRLAVEPGFVNQAPAERSFQSAFDDEVERFRRFLIG